MYYQPITPLSFASSEGAYKSITEISQTIKQDVLYLLQTSPGEWPGRPELGVGVRRFLFENYGSPELESLHERIQQQFKKYMPFLEVRSHFVTEDNRGNSLIDENYLKLFFEYKIDSLEIQKSLIFRITQEAISILE